MRIVGVVRVKVTPVNSCAFVNAGTGANAGEGLFGAKISNFAIAALKSSETFGRQKSQAESFTRPLTSEAATPGCFTIGDSSAMMAFMVVSLVRSV
jgi:hypothetical protein